MKSYRLRLLTTVLLVIVLSLALAACGSKEEPTPTPEPPPADTPEPPPPTDTPEPPPPTDTPEPPPPTNTPVPTETPTPDPTAGFESFESAEGGYTLQYPGEWFTADVFGFATFASAEELLDSPDLGEKGGVAIVIAGDAAEFEADEPVALLEETAAEFDLADDAEMTEGPTAVTINGQDAATAVIKGDSDSGAPLAAFITIVLNNDRVVIMIAATPAETEADFRPIFEAMANSIDVGEPTVADVEIPDLPETEGFLLYGDTATATVPADGSSAWEFIGLEGEVIDIIVRPTSVDLDAVVDLLDESGASVLEIEIDDSFGVEELRGFALPSSGSFTILIRGFAGSGGDYEIILAEAGALTGTEGAIGYNETMAGSVISTDGSTWGFSGKAGDFVDVTVVPFDEFDLVVDVLDASGLSLLDEGPVDDSFDTEFVRILRLPDDGQYTIVVTGYQDTSGDYEVTLGLSNGGQPGSIVFAADTLTAEDTAGHAFPFTALTGEVVTFQVDPEVGFDVVLEVHNDDTDALVMDPVDLTTGFEEIVFTTPEDANYYFLVKGFEDSIGDYDATLLGSDFIIFELAKGDGVIGRFNEDGLIEYLFRGTAGDTIVLTAETTDELDLVLEILDMDDNSLLQIDVEPFGGVETLTYIFEEDQAVFIRVSEFFSEQGQFTLLVDSE